MVAKTAATASPPNNCNHSPGFGHHTIASSDFSQFAGDHSPDFDGDLVGFNFEKPISILDLVAHGLEPCEDFNLGNRLAQLWHDPSLPPIWLVRKSAYHADLNGESAQSVARSIGGAAIAVTVDVANRDSIKAAIAAADTAFGKLDVMFNNAGISQTCNFMDVTEADWHRIMDVNALGVLIGTQEAAGQMKAQVTGGKIINTASIAAKQGYPLFAHYCASKFAVAALTQAAARALAADKITVNAFCSRRGAHGIVGAA